MNSTDEKSNVKMKKKIKNIEFNFVDLPPRVVVNEIFSFIEILIRSIERNEVKNETLFKKFDNFGYFKRDKLRNIWSFFVYFNICEEFWKVCEMMKRSTVQSLSFLHYFKVVRPIVKSQDRNDVVVLPICKKIEIWTNKFTEFFEKFKFEKLEHLIVFHDHEENEDFHYEHLFYNLKDLYFNSSSIYPTDDNFNSFFSSNCLEKLELSNVSFEKHSSWSKFTKLRDLSICGSGVNRYRYMYINEFFLSREFPSLVILKLSCLDLKYTSLNKICFEKIQKLSISICNQRLAKILEGRAFKMLEFLYLDVWCILGNEELNEIKWGKMPILECLSVHSNNFSGSIFRCDSINSRLLKVLNVGHCAKFSGENIYGLENIEEMTLGQKVNDWIFINTNLKTLKKLTFFNSQITGKKWNPLLNLKNLTLTGCKMVSDEIFQNFLFPKLIYLDINVRNFTFERATFKFYEKLKGENWNIFSDLESLSLESGNFCDLIFQNDSFPKLNHLKLSNLGEMIGNWNVDLKVEKLKFHGCEKMKDSVMKCFKKVKRIKLFKCNEMKGEKWPELHDLIEIDIESCEIFTDEFFQSPRENLKIIKIKNSPNVKRKNWSAQNL